MSSFDRVLEMVNEKNQPTYPLTAQSVTLGDLAVEDSSTHNTRVTMKAVGNSGYRGQVDLFYTRALLTALGQIVLVREQPFSYEEVLGLINQTKNAQMTADDFTNTGLPVVENGVVTTFTLSAKSTSLVWLGNTQVTLLTGLPAEAPAFDDWWDNTAATLFT